MFANKYKKYSTIKSILLSIKNNVVLIIVLSIFLFGSLSLISFGFDKNEVKNYYTQGILNNSTQPFTSTVYSYVEGTVKDSSFLEKEATRLSQNGIKHKNESLYTVEELTSAFSFPAYNAGSVLYSYKITFTNYDETTMLSAFNFLLDDIVNELKEKYPSSFANLSISQYGSYPTANVPTSIDYTGIFALSSLVISLLIFIIADYYLDFVNEESDVNELDFTSFKMNAIRGNKAMKALFPFVFYSKNRLNKEKNIEINKQDMTKLVNRILALKKVIIIPIEQYAFVNSLTKILKNDSRINVINYNDKNSTSDNTQINEDKSIICVVNDVYSFSLDKNFTKNLLNSKVLFVTTKLYTKKSSLYNTAQHLISSGFADSETSIFVV